MNKFLLVFLVLWLNAIHSQNRKLDSVRIIYLKQVTNLKNNGADTSFLKTLKHFNSLYNSISQYDSAIYFSEKGLLLTEKINFNSLDTLSVKVLKKNKAEVLNNFAESYRHKGDYNKALETNFKALKLREQIKSKKGIGFSYTNIGNVYVNSENYERALEYLLKGYEIFKEINFEKGMVLIDGNLGIIYQKQMIKTDDSILALQYFEKALNSYLSATERNNKLKEIKSLSGNYNNLGLLYQERTYALKNKQEKEVLLRKALQYFLKSLKIEEELENSRGIGAAKNNIGTVYQYLGQYKLADNYLIEGLKIFQKNKSKEAVMQAYLALAELSGQEKKFESAYEYHKLYTLTRDSILNIAQTESAADMAEKYNSEKKEQENKLLQTENKLSTATIKQQKLISYFIVGGLIIVSFLAFFIFNGLKKQRVANKIISLQKQEVESQKHLIEEHQKETIDSINYAKRIQYALLANSDLLKQNLPEHFVLFNPKDIVSGDFYWATHHENKFYLAVCDSTGHGVPGAFMSLLNMGFLSEAIKEKGIYQPNEILNYVRKRLIESIGNDGQQDGMDAILMCIDNGMSVRAESRTITYSAANNEPILISEGKIIELPKDKMPVGKGEKTESFTLHTIEANKGDILYLYTDGYADQFGGPKGKKFKYKALNELLLAKCTKEPHEQMRLLNQTFIEWKGNLEQVDDVCIIGIKI